MQEEYIKAKRIIYNPASNDWNNESEYKLQKVRIYGESISKQSYIIDSYGKKKFSCHKSNVFVNKKDFLEKMDNIVGFNLSKNGKDYLFNQM